MGSFIGLKDRPLAEAIATLGWIDTLKALDYLIEHAARIANPNAYLRRMLSERIVSTPVARRS